MKRVLTFDGEKGAKRFSMLHLSLMSAGDGKGERNREILRKEARLLDALDTVSVEDPSNKEERKLMESVESLRITITQDDFDLLSKYVDSTPWVPRIARDAVDLFDWLAAADKIET